jgi:hypothetical protein
MNTAEEFTSLVEKGGSFSPGPGSADLQAKSVALTRHYPQCRQPAIAAGEHDFTGGMVLVSGLPLKQLLAIRVRDRDGEHSVDVLVSRSWTVQLVPSVQSVQDGNRVFLTPDVRPIFLFTPAEHQGIGL